jgi:hypothetical protein
LQGIPETFKIIDLEIQQKDILKFPILPHPFLEIKINCLISVEPQGVHFIKKGQQP